MFARFTDRARRVVVQAQEEARTLNHNYTGTEHILLGLIREGGVAAQVLVKQGGDLNRVRQQVIHLLHDYQARHDRQRVTGQASEARLSTIRQRSPGLRHDGATLVREADCGRP